MTACTLPCAIRYRLIGHAATEAPSTDERRSHMNASISVAIASAAVLTLGLTANSRAGEYDPNGPPTSTGAYAIDFRWTGAQPDLSAIKLDLDYAESMRVHHQGALDMARSYNTHPMASNDLLRRMNLDIIQDQSYEIALMQALIAHYPGDANLVAIDPTMIHGMPKHDASHAEHAAR
jgi:uncharacterized protein (DUF305 family)